MVDRPVVLLSRLTDLAESGQCKLRLVNLVVSACQIDLRSGLVVATQFIVEVTFRDYEDTQEGRRFGGVRVDSAKTFSNLPEAYQWAESISNS